MIIFTIVSYNACPTLALLWISLLDAFQVSTAAVPRVTMGCSTVSQVSYADVNAFRKVPGAFKTKQAVARRSKLADQKSQRHSEMVFLFITSRQRLKQAQMDSSYSFSSLSALKDCLEQARESCITSCKHLTGLSEGVL